MNNNKIRKPNYLLRILAGGYLVYLAYQMVTDPLFRTMTGWRYAVQIVAAIVFVGFGLWFVYYGVKGTYLQSKENTEGDFEADNEMASKNDLKETIETEQEVSKDTEAETRD